MPPRILLTTVLLCASVGCSNNTGSVTTVAEDDPRLKGTCTLYRLNGDRYPGEPIPEGSQHLHGWEILESCSVNDLSDRSELLGAFDKGIFISSKESVDCFNPRHALRLVHDGVTTDHLICFQCFNYSTWINGESTGGGSTGASARDPFNRLLETCTAER